MARDSFIASTGGLPTELAAAIRAACAARGDSSENRDALLAECLAMDDAGQADMLAHFRAEAAAWAAGAGGGTPS